MFSGKKKIFFLPQTYPRKRDKDRYTVDVSVEMSNSKVTQFSAHYVQYVVPTEEKECILITELDGW